MRIFLKILSFLILILITCFSGWKFGREITKSKNFGDEFIGQSKEEVITKFGKPDIITQKLASEFNNDFKYFYEDLNCNPRIKITYIQYDKFWFEYEFWLLNKNNSETVILVK